MAAIEIAPGGALCAGRYRLERRLGAGGMASVWRAQDAHLQRPVAVKILSDTLAGDEDYVSRFRREARVAASLSHPRLVRVFDFGEELGRPFLVMELIDGPTLAGLLRRQTEVDVDPRALACDLLDALAHVHDAGIIHRDVKPANVLIAPDGRLRLTDFGVAQPPDATQLTGTGLVIGTLRYLAPEVVSGEPATVRSDLFAVGRLLREVTDSARVDGGLELRALIEQLVREDPRDRPASAHDALRALEATEATLRAPRRAAAVPRTPRRQRSQTTRPLLGELPGRRWAPARDRLSRWSSRRPDGADPGTPTASRLATLIPTVLVAAAIIIAVALAESGGSSRSKPRTAPPTAPLARQLEAIGRALDGISR